MRRDREQDVHVSGGIGFFGLLTLLFIALKLLGAITWSWWWVLSPIWIPWAIIFLIIFIIIIILAIKECRR